MRQAGGVVVCAALALLAAPDAGARPPAIGGWNADSGQIQFEGPRKLVLAESARDTDGPGGRLGFQTAAGWFHATHPVGARHPRRPRLVLATDDPAGRTITVRFDRSKSGVRLRAGVTGGPTGDVTALGIGFDARAAERYLGFGERSNAVDQRGSTVSNYVGEGPYLPGEYSVPAATVPPWGFEERGDATYFPMPWLVSTRGFGVLVNNYEHSLFRLGTEDPGEWSVEAEAHELDLTFIPGPEPADVVRRLTERTGRQPKPVAPWQLGPWFQTGHANQQPEELSYLQTLRDADAPVSAMETHMRYLPCGVDQGHEESERARAAAIHAAGLAAISYLREAVCSTYSAVFAPAASAGVLLRHPDGSPYLFRSFVGTGVTDVGMFDFSNPDAYRVYKSVADRPFSNGFDGWMEDYGEYVPPDSVADNGMTGAQMHNYYPVLYHCAGHRFASTRNRPTTRFIRSGWTGVHPCAQIVWGGDPTTGWGFDGLSSAVIQALSMGLSGISTWGSDIGGFFTLSDQRLDPELLARWVEFGAVSGVMRTKAEGVGASKAQRPQIWEQPTLPIWRRYAKLRTQLYPYLVAADAEYRSSGMPLMRHLSLVYPDDRRALAREDEFLFGDDLLVAPVLEPGATERELYLPEGGWIDLWRAVTYDEASGGLDLGRAAVVRGRRSLTVPAPLEELPTMVRAGALVPLLPAGVDTLAGYGRDAPGLTHLRDRRDRLHLLAFPRGFSRARLYTHGRLRSTTGKGVWRLLIDSPRELRVEVEASLTTLRDPFVPKRVEVDGRPIRSWSYDRRERTIRIRLPKGAEAVAVTG
jgi:alpha-glucosidase (family GH31 glycosyl hydrolase)